MQTSNQYNNSIYIHIPFCLKKCNYCDFYSIPLNEEMVVSYFNALQKEIEMRARDENGYIIQSIFIGGGTPTSVDMKYIEKTINCITRYFRLSNSCEITIEANPATNIDYQALSIMGFNRISIGVQSFVNEELLFLDRLHDAYLARKTVEDVVKYYKNVNIDLMFSIPIQTQKSLEFSLQTAVDLNVQHISAYSLIYEEGTLMNKYLSNNRFSAKTEEEDAELYEMVYTILKQNNYLHYEVSNFAKHNFECKHNLNYWKRGEYFGFGTAAHSFLNGCRFSNLHNIHDYCNLLKQNKLPIGNFEKLTKDEIAEEKIFLGLRSNGIDLINCKLDINMNYIDKLVDNGLAILSNNKLKLTSKGYFLCDEIAIKLL